MTTRSEDVLYASLTDIDALETLAKIGLDPECVPTEAMRPVVKWALDQYFDSGRKQAPSREMLVHVWGSVLEDEEIELVEEDLEVDTIESAVDNLKDLYAHRQYQQFIKTSATEMATALPTTKVETLTRLTNDLFKVTSRLQDHSNETSGYQGFLEAFADYDQRVVEATTYKGMTFGLAEIDQHTYGIHPGEMAILAAGPKVGKSYFACRVALHEWDVRERRVVLFSLENTVEMTRDRIACLKLGLDPRQWQRGLVLPEVVEQHRRIVHDELSSMPGALLVVSPPRGARTPEMLIREAQMRGADSVIVDQLTHVEHPDPGHKARHELFNENVHDFADLIKQGRNRLPLLVMHQINRAGIEAAKKQDYHEMHHLAESAGVERAASWVFSLFQNHTERTGKVAKFQILASRREDIENWEILWGPHTSLYRVRKTITLSTPTPAPGRKP